MKDQQKQTQHITNENGEAEPISTASNNAETDSKENIESYKKPTEQWNIRFDVV